MAKDKNVAPTGSRLYRRLAACFAFFHLSPMANRRYSRLPVGATTSRSFLESAALSALGLLLCLSPFSATAQIVSSNLASQLLEISGKVEISLAADNAWRAAKANDLLRPGDRLRTGADSRAMLRLSDKSVIRIDQSTLLEIMPPAQPAGKSRFRLQVGALFFLNREKPADIEFDTPLATGAIRGTEFLLAVAQAGGDTTLALYDGAVELRRGAETISLASGQQAVMRPGRPAAIGPALPARNLIQWTFYYPGVLNPSELQFNDTERGTMANSLTAYRDGDLLGALAALPDAALVQSDSARAFRAGLKLAVGRVDDAEQLLARLPAEFPPARALREVIAATRFDPEPTQAPLEREGRSSSEWLAHSYYLQSQSHLPEALVAARRAVERSGDFGFAWTRVAELEFSFAHRGAARKALAEARRLSPRNANVFVVEGFISLEEHNPHAALERFDKALTLDASLGQAWLGRSLAHEQLHDAEEGRRDLQAAAALEPQRSLFRSYLGKAFSQARDDALAEKDLRLARQFDPADPTPWLYSALHHQQVNQINDSVSELERSIELNDNRSIFRSRLLLDRDRAIRTADLAAIYDEAGLSEVSRLEASRSVSEDYANFSGHLFLARSLQAREDPNSYDLRFETPRQSELLVANLLAPIGGANLSQLLSQQAHLQYFDPKPFGLSSLTEYSSRGDWDQSGTAFGTIGRFSYALDSQYLSHNGQRPNNDLEQTRYIFSASQQITPNDSVYAQVGLFKSESGDVAQHYDPTNANLGLRVKEKQEPTFYAGYHHEWSPGLHTLFLVGHLRDHLALTSSDPGILFLPQSGGSIIDIGLQPYRRLSFESEFDLTSVDLQQIWEIQHHAVIFGARYQHGSVDNTASLEPLLPSPPIGEPAQLDLERISGYAYYQFRPISRLRLTGGVSYDEVTVPQNADLPPLSDGEMKRSLLAPKAAIEFEPWRGGHLRGAYTRSLGGLYFDNSVRLEPTQLAGFTTAYRSLIPESVDGLVPGTKFETWGAGFEQSFPSSTYVGVEGDILESHGERGYGAVSNLGFPPKVPDTAAVTRQTLKFRERAVSAYLNQLVGHNWSLGANYTLSEAKRDSSFPDVPASAPSLPHFAQGQEPLLGQQRAVLGHLQLSAIFNHPAGFFGQWHSGYFHQSNFHYQPSLAGDSFWQHDLFIGYRFPHRLAELRFGILNLTDQDYRLNPLNLQNELPRGRTFTASLRLNL